MAARPGDLRGRGPVPDRPGGNHQSWRGKNRSDHRIGVGYFRGDGSALLGSGGVQPEAGGESGKIKYNVLTRPQWFARTDDLPGRDCVRSTRRGRWAGGGPADKPDALSNFRPLRLGRWRQPRPLGSGFARGETFPGLGALPACSAGAGRWDNWNRPSLI